jgi:hypothetical protein
MKRTTILLPDDLAYLLDRERRRRGVSTAAIVREAIAAHFNISERPRRLRIVGIADSGPTDLGQNFEQYLAEAWGSADFYEEVMGHPPPESGECEEATQDDHAADPSALTTGAGVLQANSAVADGSEQGA